MLTKLPRGGIAVLLVALLTATAPAAEEYEIGGPLAGVKLPALEGTDRGEVRLYPGAAEHWRAYWMKYLPCRSFFDAQSQLAIWTAPKIPILRQGPEGQAGAESKPTEKYAAPLYKLERSSTGASTGATRDPVEVIRCKVRDPVFKLDLGTRGIGLYAVRVIGAVETARLRPFREPVFVTLRINDGLKGEVQTYRQRVGYVDEFYSIAEFYFHAPESRRYTAELFVDEGSTVDLLVRNVTLDDVLAGATQRPIKTRMTLTTPDEVTALKTNFTQDLRRWVGQLKPFTPEERLARDERVWKWLPPVNAQGEGNWFTAGSEKLVGLTWGTAEAPIEEIEAQFGKWERPGHPWEGNITDFGTLVRDPEMESVFLENKKLGLKYLVEDLIARKPLPDPYPVKDEGSGLFFPAPGQPENGRMFAPIAREVDRRFREASSRQLRTANLWLQSGNRDLARDAAVMLVHYAYLFPTRDDASYLASITRMPAGWGRDYRCRQRCATPNWMGHYANYPIALQVYDRLFDFIKGNEELAQSVHRFVPWVKTSQDVIQLLDVYLVQMTAKRILRYHYLIDNRPTDIVETATALGDPGVTGPWMEWLCARAYVYPNPVAGLQDLMISGNGREGAGLIGSTFYSLGEGAAPVGASLDRYLEAGGDPKFNFADPQRYPKPLAHCYWSHAIVLGGMDFARMGDVCGPDKPPGTSLNSVETMERDGWKWSGDPHFAWPMKNIFGRKRENDADWKRIEEAAATLRRAPWLDNRSRAVEDWFGALESGLDHDDFRLRRAAYVRTGIGYGHAHDDALDLQFVAHGLPMTIDGGQRSGYSKPNDRQTRVHNTVEVDGQENLLRSSVTTLSDAAGARYLQAVAEPPAGASLFARQVALIDVDEGGAPRTLPVELQKPGAKLPPQTNFASSYIFDVFRVAGGRCHTYCFHGPVGDAFEWNATAIRTVASLAPTNLIESAAAYLSPFVLSDGAKVEGLAPALLQGTWRYSREGFGSELKMLQANFDPASPRKFTRLHVVNETGARVLAADSVRTEVEPYRFRHMFVQRRGEALESAFTAVIEPYAGEPFIQAIKPVAIADNETDARRAVAIEVTTQNGHTDLCFADGRPEKVRKVSSVECRVSGEFGFISKDSQGIRLASLTGGTLLEAPGVKLVATKREHTGKVLKVDYLKKEITIDQAWPAAGEGDYFAIGTVEPSHWTHYTAARVAPAGKGSLITVTRGADRYRSPIREIQDDRVRCALAVVPGQNWVASNDQMTKFWRADSSTNTWSELQFTGPAPQTADFAPSGALRLWEYGVGDTVRLPTHALVRRTADGGYEAQGNTDLEITLNGKVQKVSAADLAKGPVRLAPH